MEDKQKTIAKEISFSGIGLHTGNPTNVILKPAKPDYGVRFIRTDLPGKPVIPAIYKNVLGILRGTTIGLDKVTVYTTEHFLAALHGLGIDNIEIQLDNNEPPVFDSSVNQLVEYLKQAGIVEQDQPRKYICLQNKIEYRAGEGDNVTELIAYPADELKIDYTIVYDHPLVSRQSISLSINPDNFTKEIAPARTFCFDYEIEALKKRGLAKGGSLENTIVIGIDRIHNQDKLRYENEFVRHKLLDLLGDIYLLGRPLKAHIVAFRSGHQHNINFVKKVAQQETLPELNLEQIKKIIPHREPFLMVDRVTITEEQKSATGYKLITGKEDFFKGHFPGNPIMPGVLIIESMAQAACVLFLSRPDLAGKTIAYFASIDKTKFRKPVFPGNELELKIEVLKTRTRTGKVKGQAFVKGNLVVESEFMFMLIDKK